LATNDLGPAVTAVLAEWAKDPGLIFAWRSNALQMSLLVLEEIIRSPQGQGRARDLSRIRAISQLQSLTVAMETMRTGVPIVCPHCETEFNLT